MSQAVTRRTVKMEGFTLVEIVAALVVALVLVGTVALAVGVSL
jgi:hypothetical protein